jgi:hypothetical protein
VLNNLVETHSDVVRFCVSGEDIAGGMLPIMDATGLIDGARHALLASACSVVSKTKHHPRMSRGEADDFLRICKLGQTELGSYVIKVVCPLNEMPEPPLLPDVQPFARETTALLARACAKIVSSIEQDTVDQMLTEEESQPEVTSNLCDALLRMHATREKSSLTVDVGWAAMPKLDIPKTPHSSRFKPEYFRMVEEIGRHLRPVQEEQREMRFFGTVETLNGDVGDDGRRSGEVSFALLLRDEDIVRARGNLAAEDYEKAVHAHEKGLGYVSFDGILKRGIRVSKVEQIQNFSEITA